MKRKSPIRHMVRAHKKKSKVVHAYVRGKGQRLTHLANPTISLKTFDYDNATPKMIAAWAIKKYGHDDPFFTNYDDVLYMLKETGEGREVFGDKKTDEAIKIVEELNAHKYGYTSATQRAESKKLNQLAEERAIAEVGKDKWKNMSLRERMEAERQTSIKIEQEGKFTSKVDKTYKQGKIVVIVTPLGHGGTIVVVKGLTPSELKIAKDAEWYDNDKTAKQFEKEVFSKIKKLLPTRALRNDIAEASFRVNGNELEFDTGD